MKLLQTYLSPILLRRTAVRHVVFVGCMAIGLSLFTAAMAQYAISAYSTTPLSVGGDYTLVGKLGGIAGQQRLESIGGYSLHGGGAGVVVNPLSVTIAQAGPNSVTLSWASESNGRSWILQETESLSPAAWTNSPSAGTNAVTIPASSTAKYYRLVLQ